MFVLGVVVWLISFIAWLILIVHPTTRSEGLYWLPLVTLWLGNIFMWMDR